MHKIILPIAFVVCLIAGCASPYKWTVEALATPNPLVAERTFSLAPISYEGLRVGEKSEAEYLEGKTEAQRDSWAGDKAAVDEEFRHQLTSELETKGLAIGAGGGYILRPVVRFIEPGWNAGLFAKPTKITMHLRVSRREDAADKAAVDEISFENLMGAAGYTVRQRLVSAGSWLGQTAAHYVEQRTANQVR